MGFFRENIDRMAPYVPGEQPKAGEAVIKLNTNENPYPPSPAATAVLRELGDDNLRLYPDAMARSFCDAAAEVLDVPADWILPGNGSDDLIIMIARTCAGETRPVVYPTPTFTFYETQALIEDAPVVEAPFDEEFNLPVDDLAAAGGAVTFVTNPNSPSGTAATNQQLRDLASRLSGLLVIDEAYVDFADSNALELVGEFDNVVVLRTLSKGYSLAGLRLGFAVSKPTILEGLVKAKAIYNVGAAACAVGAAAMKDQAAKNANAAKIVASRTLLTVELESLSFKVWDSQANFLLARPEKAQAADVYKRLKDRGILVRYFDSGDLCDKLRITIGTDEQNAALVAALKEII